MQKYQILLSQPELDIIGEALGKLPLEKSGDLFFNLKNQWAAIQAAQIVEQNKAAASAEPPIPGETKLAQDGTKH